MHLQYKQHSVAYAECQASKTCSKYSEDLQGDIADFMGQVAIHPSLAGTVRFMPDV